MCHLSERAGRIHKLNTILLYFASHLWWDSRDFAQRRVWTTDCSAAEIQKWEGAHSCEWYYDHTWLHSGISSLLFCVRLWTGASSYFPLTKGFLGPNQAESEGDSPRLLLQHFGHLIVSTANDALVIDGLYVVPDAHGLQAVYGAAFLYSLQKQTREE